ncbi:MAG: hypothetical protein U0610_26305 [bacterium]
MTAAPMRRFGATPRSAEARVLAAIDVGTNMVRMRVERRGGGEPAALVFHDWEITRLGGGQGSDGALTAEAMERTARVLARFGGRARELGAAWVWAAGTSAVREATNQREFVSLVRARAGLDLAVVDGAEEARLDALGALGELGGEPRQGVLVDIGGGSTELVRIEGGAPAHGRSYPVGVVRLTERLLSADPPTRDELQALEAAARAALADGRELVAAVRSPGFELVANSGTATTLAAVDLGLRELDPERIRGHRVDRATVDRIYHALACLPAARRLDVPGVARGREDLIIAGLALLRATMDLVGVDGVRISTGGLLEGLLADRARAAGWEE